MKEIFERRSIRKYLDKPVEAEKTERLLKAAMTAPGDQREWRFIVITDRSMLEALSQISPYAVSAAKAPMAIMVLADLSNANPHFVDMAMGACVQNILLEAVHLGLGAVWLTVAPVPQFMKAVTELLHLPEYIKPFAIVPVGYPGEVPAFKDRWEPGKAYFDHYSAT